MKGKLLIIDDDKVFCALLKKRFSAEYEVSAFTDPEEAVRNFRERGADVVLTDLHMPKVSGLEMLRIVKAEPVDTDVIVMTAYSSADTAVQAMKDGAYDYIIKPFDTDELSLQLKNLFEKRRLSEENLSLRKIVETTYRPENIIGESAVMKEVYRTMEILAGTDATVLITGKSGTGKELVARALHFSGRRKEKRFVSVNCTALPETLLESELFGHVKGAFTGAVQDKAGLFEHADGGTIFLDEIADAPLTIQAKLLRVLQDRIVRPVGGTREIEVDVRVVCATNRDMREMIEENRFREDLYYRINVFSVHLPPLRERKEDIPLLIRHFLKGRKQIHPSVVAILSTYGWPGNARELQNMIERLVTFATGDVITTEDLPHELQGLSGMIEEMDLSYNDAKRKILDEFNRAILNRTLVKHEGNVSRAAEELKLDRANLQRLMRKYHISSREFRKTEEDVKQ